MLTLWMLPYDYQYSLYLLTPSFWSYWFNMCANAHNHQLTLLNIFSAQTSFWTWAGSWPNYLSSIVPLVYSTYPSLIKSVCFWSFVLEIIIPLLSKHRIIQMFYNPMPFAFFLPLIEYRYSHQLRYGSPDSLLDFIPHHPSYSLTLWAFPRV